MDIVEKVEFLFRSLAQARSCYFLCGRFIFNAVPCEGCEILFLHHPECSDSETLRWHLCKSGAETAAALHRREYISWARIQNPRAERRGRGRRGLKDRSEAGIRSEVNNSLIIVNNFHKLQNFRQLSDLFSQIWLKKRHTSLFSRIWREIRKKIHQNSKKKMQFSILLSECCTPAADPELPE